MSKRTTSPCIGTVHGHTTLPGTSSLDIDIKNKISQQGICYSIWNAKMARRESLYFDVLTSLPVLVVNLVLLGMVVAGPLFLGGILSALLSLLPLLVWYRYFFYTKKGRKEFQIHFPGAFQDSGAGQQDNLKQDFKFDIDDRVRIFFDGQWLDGSIVKRPQNGLGYAVNCDCWNSGNVTYVNEAGIRAITPTHPNDGECMPDDKINQIFKSQPLPNSGDSMYSSKGVAIQITNP